jgi:NADP-dependent 3-hydroxy acid dehydrogenase YdfG
VAPRTVFITGASSGIGRALALEYASRGISLALAARRAEELEHVAEEVRARGGSALCLPLDVTDIDAVRAAVTRADAELGSLDMVIANAGIGTTRHSSRLEWSDVDEVIDVNVRGAMATLVVSIPIMIAHQRGHLVGISSLAGRRGFPGSAAYSASKAALTRFLESLRIDLAPAGIRVTDVQPGFVATPLNAASKHPKPFLWQVDRASKHITRKLDKAPAVIAFPWPAVAALSLTEWLPPWIYDRVMRVSRG